MTKIMKKQHTIVIVFHDFEGFQKMMEIMKKQHTIAHGLGTHNIACVLYDF